MSEEPVSEKYLLHAIGLASVGVAAAAANGTSVSVGLATSLWSLFGWYCVYFVRLFLVHRRARVAGYVVAMLAAVLLSAQTRSSGRSAFMTPPDVDDPTAGRSSPPPALSNVSNSAANGTTDARTMPSAVTKPEPRARIEATWEKPGAESPVSSRRPRPPCSLPAARPG